MNQAAIFAAAPLTALAATLLLGLSEARAQSEPAGGNTLALGIGAGFDAKYAGAKKVDAGVLPVLDYQMSNGFFASSLRGIGWGGSSGPMGYSASLGLRGGRDDEDKKGISGGSKELKGMGEIKAIGTLNLGLNYRLTDTLQFSAGVELPLSKGKDKDITELKDARHGRVFRLGAEAGVWSDDRHELSIGLSASAGDKKYVQAFFGVTPAQAVASKYAVYAPKSGFHSLDASVSWKYKIDSKWGVMSSLGATRLLGDAAKSPIVQRKASPTGMVMLTYLY
ncbi:MipA/OmpV family protein [Paucibacter sp. PLA-PC-4]|uniref:MipA/OmpV family protein n=1 Tax=Paucibacter sp. PLA-PC-4 TaxID=2993655 RepID=UPI0022496412|nr:MipA/OmpV family protein [Paucibacter sp. PLA-PC-4]MCX2861725.1 MipA/OmpV family protein [Paucibacter sp. PLA-PC-4]